MTLVEALSQGAQVTVVGLTIVFSVLIILMLVMMLMKVIFYHPDGESKKKTKQSLPAKKAAIKDEELIAVLTAATYSMNEEELIAVLTAAVAASLNTSTYHLNIKSYRRIENNAPAWNKAGLRDVIDARY